MDDKLLKFTEKSRNKHGDKYDYSKVEYVDSLTKVEIVCPKHGSFFQTPQSHVRGNGCPYCANEKRGNSLRDDIETFILKAKEIHGNKYDYSNVKYINANTDVEIICPKHGSFLQKASVHIRQKSGCPKCSGRNLSSEEIIKLFKRVHGDKYDYSKVEYSKMHEKVKIICEKHGEFEQTPSKHILGQGCPKCGEILRNVRRKLTTEEFIEKANKVHNSKYDYSLTKYNGTYCDTPIICRIHGIFVQRANDHLNGHGCPICGSFKQMSNWENDVAKYINSIGIDIKLSSKAFLGDKREIDILAPNERIGVECNGLYWHCEKFRNKHYHLNKTKECKINGFRLLHIFEDEWENKCDIVKSMINCAFHKITNKVYARKCEIKEVDDEEKKRFLNENDIKGNCFSNANIGLYFDDELVSIMTFKEKDEYWEMVRFCNKVYYTVNGGASKLFNFFVKRYNPRKVIAYSDKRLFNGEMYKNLGFEHIGNKNPDYFYVLGKERKNKFSFRKDMLVKEGFDENKTEHQIMFDRGIYRIYDCGYEVYVWLKRWQEQ